MMELKLTNAQESLIEELNAYEKGTKEANRICATIQEINRLVGFPTRINVDGVELSENDNL